MRWKAKRRGQAQQKLESALGRWNRSRGCPKVLGQRKFREWGKGSRELPRRLALLRGRRRAEDR